MRLFRNEKGESLIELLVSVALLGIVSVVFLRAVTSLVSINKKTDLNLNSTYMAERTMEYLVSKADMPINTLIRTISNSSDFNATIINDTNPYSFKLIYDDRDDIYATVTIEYRTFSALGHMSRATVTVYDSKDVPVTSLATALYWE